MKVLCTPCIFFEKVLNLNCCQKLRALIIKMKEFLSCGYAGLILSVIKYFVFCLFLIFSVKKNILADIQEVKVIALVQGNVKGCSIVQLWKFRDMNLLYCVSVMVVHFLSV